MLKASKLSCGANNKVDKILSSLEEASGNAKGIVFFERKCLSTIVCQSIYIPHSGQIFKDNSLDDDYAGWWQYRILAEVQHCSVSCQKSRAAPAPTWNCFYY